MSRHEYSLVNLKEHLIFLFFLRYDSLSDTAKRWLEYEWILPDAQQRVLKLLIEWTADKDLFPIEISHSILHLLQKTEILSVIHLDSKRYQLQEFKKDQNTPLTALHRSGNSFSCIDYHKIYTCTFINFRMKNTSSNPSAINTYPSSSSKINFPSRAEKIAIWSAFVIEAFLIKTPNVHGQWEHMPFCTLAVLVCSNFISTKTGASTFAILTSIFLYVLCL